MLRRLASLLALVTAALTLSGAWALPASAVAFTAAAPAAPPSTWHAGKALAAADRYLVQAWASDCPPPTGACATDDRPTMGVFVQRARDVAVRPHWSRPIRVSPNGAQASRPAIAAKGTTVAVGWVSQTSYLRYEPAAPRSFSVRISVDQGATWRHPVRLSPRGGRVDYPRLAVAGRRVYATWTDADSGAIRFAISEDRGRTWTKRTVAMTTSKAAGWQEGFAGYPDVGASGNDVALIWFAGNGGAQRALVSAVGGTDLRLSSAPAALVGASPNHGEQYPAAAGSAASGDPRVALAYTTGTGLAVRIFDGATLGPRVGVLTWPLVAGGIAYGDGYGPAVLPTGRSHLLVAVAACRRNAALAHPCNPASPGARIDVLYTESTDGGATWLAPRRLTDATVAPYKVNDEPSLALTGRVRQVSFDRYQSSFVDYRVWMRSGS